MTTRKKHYDLIVKWADGKQIQQWQPLTGNWLDINHPLWDEDRSYRVKPDIDVGYMPIYPKWENGLFYNTVGHAEREDFDNTIGIIKLTLENGIPVSVELIKE